MRISLLKIRCPGVPGKAIDMHLLRIFSYTAKLQKCNFQSVNFIEIQFSQDSDDFRLDMRKVYKHT